MYLLRGQISSKFWTLLNSMCCFFSVVLNVHKIWNGFFCGNLVDGFCRAIEICVFRCDVYPTRGGVCHVHENHACRENDSYGAPKSSPPSNCLRNVDSPTWLLCSKKINIAAMNKVLFTVCLSLLAWWTLSLSFSAASLAVLPLA